MTLSLKDKILIISPLVPRHDRNSGDLRLYSLIKILTQNYEVTFVSIDYRPGDDQYISLLNRTGVTVYAEQFSLVNLLKTVQFKVAILEFYVTAIFYLERIRILQPGCLLIVDTVDVHYLRLKQKYELTNNEADHILYLGTKEKELCVYNKADMVITVTRDDGFALHEESSDIRWEVVSNIHEICLSDTTPEMDTLIFVGGFSHEPNVDAVLHFCNDILPLIRNHKQDLKLTIVGSNPPYQVRNLENEYIKVTGYVPETTSYLHRSHVSVAPLRYGAGMKGKIGEAMAHGVPVVTTSVGAQGMGLTNRKDVMIADSPRYFADATLHILNAHCLHAKIRSNALQIIEDNYTPKLVAQTMIVALERICKLPVKKMKLQDKAVFFTSYITQKINAKLFPR